MQEENYSVADYREMERLVPLHVDKVRLKLKDKHQIVVPTHCDDFLSRCLRLKDGDVEKATKLVLAFHSAISDFQQWDAILKPSIAQDFYNVVIPLLQRDSLGRRIVIVRVGLWDPSTLNFDQAFAFTWMLSQVLNTECRDTQRKGFVSIWDYSNFSSQHAFAMSLRRLISVGRWAQNGIMGRIKAFHSVNHNRIVGMLYSALKPFLKEKLKKRVKLHSSLEALYEHVAVENLPTFLGGPISYEDCVDRQFLQTLLNKDEYFQEMMQNRLPNA